MRICSPEFLDNEIEHIEIVLTKLAYPKKVLKQALLKARKVHFSIRKKKPPKNENKFMKLPFTKNLEHPREMFALTWFSLTVINSLTIYLKISRKNVYQTMEFMKSPAKHAIRFM